MPGMIELLCEQNISWTLMSNTLQKHIENVRKEHTSTGKIVMKEMTFYGVITQKLLGNNKVDGMFDYFNQLFINLKNNLSENERKLLRGMISNVLSNVSKDYLNFIGELATLNYYMKSGLYDLINIEEPIIQGRNMSADIFLKTKTDFSQTLIEVLNIHLENKEFENSDEIKYHLESKFNKKIKNKMITEDREIFIQPVLWLKDEATYRLLSDFYSETNFEMEKVKEPLTYCSFKLLNGSYEHKFESISTIMRF
jgi:hypothetical protein